MAKNDAALSKGKPSGNCSAENTNMHKLMKMGKEPKVTASGPKTRP